MDNLADMQSALVDYIDMVGMSGYAQREASETITGSLSSMKAAWKNLVTGFANDASDLDKLIGNLTDSIVGYTDESGEHVKGVLDNLLPSVEKSLGGIAKLIEGAAPKIIDILPGLVERVVPSVISAATDMVNAVVLVLPNLLSTVVDAIIENAPALIDSAIVLIGELSNGILDQLPQIVQLGLDLVVSLANGIAESLPELIPTIIDVVLQIVDTLTNPETLLNLVDACVAIILALADGLIDALPKLIEAVPVIIGNLVQAIIEAVPQLIFAAGELVFGLIDGLNNPDNTMALLDGTVKMLGSIIKGIVSYSKQMFEKGKEIFTNIKDGFMKFIDDPKQWGKDLIDNFISGIKEKLNHLKETVANVAKSIKDFLGFSEPKKGPLSNFHTYAPDMMNLFAKGIRDNEGVITDQIEKSFNFGERTMKFGAEYGNAYGVAKSDGMVYGGSTFGTVNININGANIQNDAALADIIAERLQIMTERRGAVFA